MDNIDELQDFEEFTINDKNECKIDEDKLNQLMELCKMEYPDIPEYFIYVYSVDYLMNNPE